MMQASDLRERDHFSAVRRLDRAGVRAVFAQR
jgi:hypothetical protein